MSLCKFSLFIPSWALGAILLDHVSFSFRGHQPLITRATTTDWACAQHYTNYFEYVSRPVRRVSGPFYRREPEAQRLTSPRLQSSETQLRPAWLSGSHLSRHTAFYPHSCQSCCLARDSCSSLPPSHFQQPERQLRTPQTLRLLERLYSKGQCPTVTTPCTFPPDTLPNTLKDFGWLTFAYPKKSKSSAMQTAPVTVQGPGWLPKDHLLHDHPHAQSCHHLLLNPSFFLVQLCALRPAAPHSPRFLKIQILPRVHLKVFSESLKC